MPPTRYVYLDYASSAPLSAAALDAREAYLRQPCAPANPNSLHTLGREAARALEQARRELAGMLGGGVRPNDVFFTSGGTESNNAAVLGMAVALRERDVRRTRVVLSAIEHDSVYDLARPLRKLGFDVAFALPDASGVVTPQEVGRHLDDTVALVSVMYANNETGIVQPIAEIARLAHGFGARMHTDAVQAFTQVPLDLSEVDAASVTAHKIGGPVGIGALMVRAACPFAPRAFGGGQEQGRRSGTQDVAGAVQLAAAARDRLGRLDASRALVAGRSATLSSTVCASGTGVCPTSTIPFSAGRLPGTVSLLVPGIESESVLLRLDALGFEVSAGSACSSGSLEPSRVLSAMGVPRDSALGSLRVSFDERVGEDELEAFAAALLSVVATCRGLEHV
jgi:cysteine desulfurase